jgi:hypothetical protein
MWKITARFRKDDCASTKQRLSAYIDRRLSPQELHLVELHLADCRNCQNQLHALQATVDLLHRLPQVSAPRSFRIAQPEPACRWTPVPVLRLATVGAAMLLILAFSADMVDLFDTPLSPVGQEGTNFSYNDNRSTAMEGVNGAGAGILSPSDGQEPDLPSDGALGSTEAGWVRPVEYGLAGLVVVLGGITAWLWLRPKRRSSHRAT